MRITVPVSGDGESWMSHMPEINFDKADMIDESGKLVIPKVIRLLNDANDFLEKSCYRQMFTSSGDDGYNVYSMTVEFLRQLAVVTHWIENRPGADAHVSSDDSPSDRRLERRMSRGQVAFCRIDVRDVATGVKFIVGYGNPNGKVIGNCENGAREFAIYVTRIILMLADRVNEKSREKNAGLSVSVEGRDANLVPDAQRREMLGSERNKIRAANEKRLTCPNNRGGFCSPSCQTCRCFKN